MASLFRSAEPCEKSMWWNITFYVPDANSSDVQGRFFFNFTCFLKEKSVFIHIYLHMYVCVLATIFENILYIKKLNKESDSKQLLPFYTSKPTL